MLSFLNPKPATGIAKQIEMRSKVLAIGVEIENGAFYYHVHSIGMSGHISANHASQDHLKLLYGKIDPAVSTDLMQVLLTLMKIKNEEEIFATSFVVFCNSREDERYIAKCLEKLKIDLPNRTSKMNDQYILVNMTGEEFPANLQIQKVLNKPSTGNNDYYESVLGDINNAVRAESGLDVSEAQFAKAFQQGARLIILGVGKSISAPVPCKTMTNENSKLKSSVETIEEQLDQFNAAQSDKVSVKQEIEQPEADFKEAIKIAGNWQCNDPSQQAQFEKKKQGLIEAIKALKQQTADDVRLKKLTPENAPLIGKATLKLAQSGDTKAFVEELNKVGRCKSPVWQRILAAVVGAAIGFFAGLMIGAITASPVAALTAIAGGVAGAIAGASVGTVAGVLTSVGLFNALNKDPAAKLVNAAKAVFEKKGNHSPV